MMSVLEDFKKLKAEGTKIVVVTSHEYWSAKILNDTDVNGILIGDDLNGSAWPRRHFKL
jgi:3-methyl-2-oxobutanoate hydroxymethyltransferase